MSLGDVQNTGYRRSVGQRNIGSQPTGAVMKNAKATSLGRNIRNRSTSSVASASKSRGSMEGYMHGASTYLNMNGAGYDSKAQQTARGSRTPKVLSGKSFDNPISRITSISHNVFDYSNRGQPSSSMRRLAKLTKLNKMF